MQDKIVNGKHNAAVTIGEETHNSSNRPLPEGFICGERGSFPINGSSSIAARSARLDWLRGVRSVFMHVTATELLLEVVARALMIGSMLYLLKTYLLWIHY